MDRKWVLIKNEEAIAGPVIASSQGAALALLRRELDVKRLPNGSNLHELEVKGSREFKPPFSVERVVHYDHTHESIGLVHSGDLTGAKEACDTRETWILIDMNGKVVCGSDTKEQIESRKRFYEGS